MDHQVWGSSLMSSLEVMEEGPPGVGWPLDAISRGNGGTPRPSLEVILHVMYLVGEREGKTKFVGVWGHG